jgi:hypothetical protein
VWHRNKETDGGRDDCGQASHVSSSVPIVLLVLLLSMQITPEIMRWPQGCRLDDIAGVMRATQPAIHVLKSLT